MTTQPASVRASGDVRGTDNALTASRAFMAGEARASNAGGNASRAPGERFDETMSRTLQQARREAAGGGAPQSGRSAQATAGGSVAAGGTRDKAEGDARTTAERDARTTAERNARTAAERDGRTGTEGGSRTNAEGDARTRTVHRTSTDARSEDAAGAADNGEPGTSGDAKDIASDAEAGRDAVATLLASADAASISIPAAGHASVPPFESITPPAVDGAASAFTSTADLGTLPAARDAASRSASLAGVKAEERPDGPPSAATKTGTAAGMGVEDPDTSGVDANDAASAVLGSDAPLESVPQAPGSSAASGADAAAARTTPDFAAQLAHARAASAANGAGIFDSSRTASTLSAQAPTPHAAAVATPLHAAAFPAHFAAEVAMLGAAGIERAEIQLQPPDLGPVRIELTLSGESARVAFSAAQPETRQAIEQSLPILKDLLAERGLALGDASVSDGRAQAEAGTHGNARTAGDANARDGAGLAASGRDTAGGARGVASRRSLLDVYA